ncbi:MAG: hypothetical protein ACLTXM_02610 [Enterococcus sp.]
MTEQITIAKTVEIPQVWMAKDEALVYFGYKNHVSTFQKILAEFKDHPDYQEGYRLPTYKVPIVRIDLFDQYLKWRDLNKFKRNKGA